MVNSIEQISRTDNFLGNTGSGSNIDSNTACSKSDVQPESTLNVTSVEVEWERGECAAAAAADTVSLPLPEEDDVESSVSAATTASRQDANSIERAKLLPNFYLTYAVHAERKGKTSAKELRLEGKSIIEAASESVVFFYLPVEAVKPDTRADQMQKTFTNRSTFQQSQFEL